MNEAEWLAYSGDPSALLIFPTHRANARKQRLFACAYAFRLTTLSLYRECRRAIEVGERFADGDADDTERIFQLAMLRDLRKWSELLQTADTGTISPKEDATASPLDWTRSRDRMIRKAILPEEDAIAVAECTLSPLPQGCYGVASRVARSMGSEEALEHAWQCTVFRDIFGNPFHPVEFDPAWRTSDVLLLAQGIYEERAFDRMPILANALQDVIPYAGCDSNDILNHLRDTNATHVRGCWALDLVLGKE